MQLFIICATTMFLCPIVSYAEKLIVIIPSKQIRRSPTYPVPANLRTPTYLKHTPYKSYGYVKSGINLPPNGQLLRSVSELDNRQNGVNHLTTPYGKGVSYATYARDYPLYNKIKGGFVPSIYQNRVPAEINRPRQHLGSSYAPSLPANGYYHQPIDTNHYHSAPNLLTKLQSVDDRQQIINNNQQLTSFQKSPEAAASSPFTKVGPIIVQDYSNNQNETPRLSDLQKETTSLVTTIPSTPNSGKSPSSGGIVLRDTLLLDDYEKKIIEFTKNWPKLSSFPGAFGSTSSFFPVAGTPLSQSVTSGLGRNSFNLDSTNSIGRQGYAVKEEIDEPPIDFRTMPINTSPFNIYPTPTVAGIYKNIYG